MSDRDEIAEAVQETIEVSTTGRWYIAEGEYEGLVSAAQGESEAEAFDSLIDTFYQRAKRAEQREQEKAFREKMREQRRELADARLERVRDHDIERYSEY